MMTTIMRQRLIAMLALLATTLTAAAQASQPCVVKQYNQKQVKTPLAGVEVTVSNAGSAVSSANGTLTLNFRTLKPGDKVNLISAYKSGYEIFNQTAVDQWFISRNNKPFNIVLIQSTQMTQIKGKLTRTSTDVYKARYKKAVGELEQLRRQDKLKEAEYNKKYDELEADYRQQLANLDKYIDQFAHIDLSELSKQELRFVELAYAGQFDEAIAAYEQLDAIGKYTSTIESIKQLNEDISKLESERLRQQESANALYAMLERQVTTLLLSGSRANNRRAGELLYRAAIADTTNVKTAYKYAKYAYNNNLNKDAVRFYKICLENSKGNLALQAYFQLQLGFIYFLPLSFDFHQSESYLCAAVESYTLLSQQDPQSKETISNFAKTHRLLGELFTQAGHYERAESHLLSSLDLSQDTYGLMLSHEKLAELYIETEQPDKAEQHYLISYELNHHLTPIPQDSSTLHQAEYHERLGDVYDSNIPRNTTKAENHYITAINLMLSLPDEQLEVYKEQLARMEYKVGKFLFYNSEYETAEICLLKSVYHYTELFYLSPEKYRSSLADAQITLTEYYKAQKDYTHLIEMALNALELYDYLDNDGNREVIARLQNDLGLAYSNIEDYENAVRHLLAASQNLTILLDKRPEDKQLASILSDIHYNLGMLYFKTEDYEHADTYLLLMFGFRCRLPQLAPDDLAEKHYRLGRIYSSYFHEQKRRACEHYRKSIAIYQNLFKRQPAKYRAPLAKCLSNLGEVLDDLHEPDAKDCMLSAIKHYQVLITTDSTAYLETLTREQLSLIWKSARNRDLEILGKMLPECLRNANILANEKATETISYHIPELCSMLCELLLLQGKTGEAFAVSERQKPDDATYYLVEGYSRLSKYYTNHGQYAEALEALDHIHELKPDNGHYYEAKGIIHFMQHDTHNAIECLMKAVELGEGGELQKTLEENRLISPEVESHIYVIRKKNSAREYATAGLSIAIQMIDKVIAMEPDNAELYDIKAEIYEKNGHPDGIGISQVELGDYYRKNTHEAKKAEACYLKALDCYAKLVTQEHDKYLFNLSIVHSRLGNLYMGIPDYAKASEHLHKALELGTRLFNNNHDNYRHAIANSEIAMFQYYYMTHDYNKSLDYIVRAIEHTDTLFQQNPDSHIDILTGRLNWLAYTYANVKDYSKAIKAIDRAIKLQPANAILYDSKGEILLMKGDKKGALKMWHKVMELEPDFLTRNTETNLHKLLVENGLIQ